MATVSCFYVSVLYTAVLRTSIAAVALGCFYFCPLDCDATVVVVDFGAVETGCMPEKYILATGCNKIPVHFHFLVEVLLLLRSASAAHHISTEAESGTGYCFLLIRCRYYYCGFLCVYSTAVAASEKRCMPEETNRKECLSILVTALLLLFNHREGCADKNKIGFWFLFDTGTQSIAFSVTGYVLLLFLAAAGSSLQH